MWEIVATQSVTGTWGWEARCDGLLMHAGYGYPDVGTALQDARQWMRERLGPGENVTIAGALMPAMTYTNDSGVLNG